MMTMADLRDFPMDARVEHVAESIRADHRAGMNSDALADLRQRIKNDAGKQIRVRADDAIVADMVAALQNGPRANLNIFADVAKRADVRRRVNLRRRRDDRGRVDARRKVFSGKNSGSTRAKAIRALGTRIRTLRAEVKGPSTKMAAAALCSALAKKASFSAKVRSPALAVTAGAKPVRTMEPSPRTSPCEFLGKLGGGEH